MIENPIDILQLQPGDTEKDAKRNFRRLSLIYHPDKNPHGSSEFQKIVEAYNAIKENPSLLTEYISYISPDVTEMSYVEISVTIEDLYMNKEKILKVFIPRPCRKCKGTGSKYKDIKYCSLCNGFGEIKNSLLKYTIGKNRCDCPKCNGTGIDEKSICDECRGRKTQNTIQTLRIKLNPYLYESKHLILKKKGEYLKTGYTQDLCVRINIKKDNTYSLIDSMLSLDVYVTPAEYYGGCTKSISVFGKEFKIKIPGINDEYIHTDNRSSFTEPQKILFKIRKRKPILNKDTIPLYKKIAEIEKKLLS